MSSQDPPDLSATLESLETKASDAQTSSYLYTVVSCGIAILASRFVPSAHRFTPLAIAAPFGAFLDWRTGEALAKPFREQLRILKTEQNERLR